MESEVFPPHLEQFMLSPLVIWVSTLLHVNDVAMINVLGVDFPINKQIIMFLFFVLFR